MSPVRLDLTVFVPLFAAGYFVVPVVSEHEV
ncbi:hypothetical protein HNQ38_002011 [Desulfovibrio intestinalis]|uniref:Uncharacterized protein n=1 Tax=Desulfovibrio intestinalis TaxID=58621 RepID=A0A7W8C248_9BACT|nr:hypothetical protein [Desulfovibrio intestinalis]